MMKTHTMNYSIGIAAATLATILTSGCEKPRQEPPSLEHRLPVAAKSDQAIPGQTSIDGTVIAYQSENRPRGRIPVVNQGLIITSSYVVQRVSVLRGNGDVQQVTYYPDEPHPTIYAKGDHVRVTYQGGLPIKIDRLETKK